MVNISDCINARKGPELNVSAGIALMPRNFEDANSKDELVIESEAPTVKTLRRQQGCLQNIIRKV